MLWVKFSALFLTHGVHTVKLVGRSSTIAHQLKTFITRGVQLCQDKLTTRGNDRRVVAKFSNTRVWDKVSAGNTVISRDTRISVKHGVQ